MLVLLFSDSHVLHICLLRCFVVGLWVCLHSNLSPLGAIPITIQLDMTLPTSLRAILLTQRLAQQCPRGTLWQSLSANCLFGQESSRTFTTSKIFRASSRSHDPDESELDKSLMQETFYRLKQDPAISKSVVVLMPKQRFGEDKLSEERRTFLLEETITLAESLSEWRVVGSRMVSSWNPAARSIFGKTNLRAIKDYIQSLNANTVVIAHEALDPIQHHYLSDYLQADVYDRFYLVLQIFRQRATSKDAKIQLALAELSYVKKNLRFMHEGEFSHKFTNLDHNPKGGKDRGGETYVQIIKNRIQEREIKLKHMLEKIDMHNEQKRQHRMKMQIPSVAVVGYTNSGKTSLIKALTHDPKIKPEDKLFATVDVSVHMAHLPSNLNVLMVDTIGFITDIPTTLVHSFKSTLSEISTADLIVHVTDCSHPDMKLQSETVHKTLREIGVPERLMNSMIEVANKVDKIELEEQEELLKTKHRLISATERIGLKELQHLIEKGVMVNTDRFMFDIRVPNGGEQYQWLSREVSIVRSEPDENDVNFLIMKVIVTKSKLGQFSKRFGKPSST